MFLFLAAERRLLRDDKRRCWERNGRCAGIANVPRLTHLRHWPLDLPAKILAVADEVVE